MLFESSFFYLVETHHSHLRKSFTIFKKFTRNLSQPSLIINVCSRILDQQTVNPQMIACLIALLKYSITSATVYMRFLTSLSISSHQTLKVSAACPECHQCLSPHILTHNQLIHTLQLPAQVHLKVRHLKLHQVILPVETRDSLTFILTLTFTTCIVMAVDLLLVQVIPQVRHHTVETNKPGLPGCHQCILYVLH